MFVMKATGWSDSAKMKARLSEVLMQVGLGSVEKKMPHQLSGGEQQRVVIARALINEPQILLADEPTGNLDPEVSNGIMKIFQQINKRGTAILMATHSYGLIKRFPTRILKCEEGRVMDSEKEKFELTSDY
jgi:cell division transport system ATP-binding protein